MFPSLYVGPLELSMYGFCILIGLSLSILLLLNKPIKDSIFNQEDYFFTFLIGFIFGFLGAKILYILTEASNIYNMVKAGTWNFESTVAIIRGGFVFYGGLIGGIFALFIFTKIKKYSFLELLDSICFVVPLAHGFGRIGCFFAGCCYGKPSEFGFYFNESLAAPHDIKLLPVQLFEAGINFIIFAVLYILSHKTDFKKKFKTGSLTFIYIPTYAIMRFILEFFRYDDYRGVLILSTSQYISIALILISIIFWVKKNKDLQKTKLG